MNTDRKDFFISYNHNDEQWAEWIAWQLEGSEARYQVVLQKWDWGPGNNFIHEMHHAAETCLRTIILLSPQFLDSQYTQPEWAAAFRSDPTGKKRLLIPIRVADCELPGFFNPLVYIDFFTVCQTPPENDRDQRELERILRYRLLEGVKIARRKPVTKPPLPGILPATSESAAANLGSTTKAIEDCYKKQLIEDVKNIDLFHLKHLFGDVPFPIDQVYIPLKVNRREVHSGVSRLQARQDAEMRYLPEERKEPRELGELLTRLFEDTDNHCMLVLGKPGSGKTTLLKYLAYYYATDRQQSIAPGLISRIPFFIRFKDLVDTLLGQANTLSLVHIIQAHCLTSNDSIKREQTQQWLEGGALVLLDGLDEVANSQQREMVAKWVKKQVKDYLKAYFIVSSRVYGFDPYYAPEYAFTVEVDDLSTDQRRDFVHRWFSHVHRQRHSGGNATPWQAEEVANRLIDTIESYNNKHLQDLAGNPLLLSMIAILQLALLDENSTQNQLPDSRAEIYENCIALFVEERNWDRAREVDVIEQPDSALDYRVLLEQAALLLQLAQGDNDDKDNHEQEVSLDRDTLIAKLHALKPLQNLDKQAIEACLSHSHQRTLLLVEQGFKRWGFQHKTFQEYLCAEVICHESPSLVDTLVEHLGQDHWRVVFDLFIEKQSTKNFSDAVTSNDSQTVLSTFLQKAGQAFEHDTALAARAWYWLEELHDEEGFLYPQAERNRLQYLVWQKLVECDDPIALVKFHNFATRGLKAPAITVQHYKQRLHKNHNKTLQLTHHLLLAPEIIATPDVELNQCIAKFLNSKFAYAVRGAAALALQRYGWQDQKALEAQLFVNIAAGEFYRGSQKGDKDASDSEIDGKPYHLDTFQIARYPVTNAQYAEFVAAKNYKVPSDWRDGQYPVGRGNHPVVYVRWKAAQAYVDWLNEQQDGHTYFLPSEAQWERAARGPAQWQGQDNRRIYPWGDEFQAGYCNSIEAGINRTSAVGCFPEGASPEGVLDMAGNVWEWCADWYTGDYYRQGKVEKNDTEGDLKVLRGGSFNYVSRLVRCAFRDDDRPVNGDDGGGFRVARI